MQSRTLTTSRRLARGRPGAAPAPGARRAPPRRCAAPSQEPSTSSSGRAPSLQSIQDGGSLDDGYQSPMLSLDWGEPAATAGGAPAAADALHLEPVFDVCGVGQCLIDVNVNVSKDMLATLDVPHGGRRVIDVAERDALLRQLEQVPSAMSGADASTLSMFNLNNVTPGGSLLNTLIGLSRLGASASNARPLRIAMAGCVGGRDRLGAYVRQQLRGAGVAVIKEGDDADALGPAPPNAPASGANGAGAPAGPAAAGRSGSVVLPGARRAAGGPGAAAAAQPPAAGGGTTGTVMVFCTPDAQRSFLSCIPQDDTMALSPELLRAAARSRVLVIEGYLFDLPGATEALPALIDAAKAAGTVVALTLGDAGVVGRSGGAIAECLDRGVDLLFSNASEALALAACPPVRALLERLHNAPQGAAADGAAGAAADGAAGAAGGSGGGDAEEGGLPPARGAAEAAEQLSRLCPMSVVTDGSRGSYVSALGQTQLIPVRWSKSAPVDTCGAGDNYAAGLLYGLLRGLDIGQVGAIAAHTASRVIARHGPQLDPSDARKVVIAAARAAVADAAPPRAPPLGGKAGAGAAAAAAGGGRSLMSVLEAHALLAAEERAAAEQA